MLLPSRVSAQEEFGEAPLGDVARSLRQKTPLPETVGEKPVIDNDNLSQVVDDAETRRAAGASPVFTLDPGGHGFHISSPDVSCSLSFNAKTTSLLADPLILDELPRTELAKLDGPATIDGDSLQISMHNGTAWELREVIIGLTIVRRPDPADTISYYGRARIVPASAGSPPQQARDPLQKQPDVTLLLHVKGSAAPSATAIFRTPLNFALFPDQDWHWAIVKAKGIPPQPSPNDAITTQAQPGPNSLPTPQPDLGTTISPSAAAPSSPPPPLPIPPNASPSNLDSPTH